MPSHSEVPSRRGVIDDHELERDPVLVEDAHHASFEPDAAIVRGDDDGHLGLRLVIFALRLRVSAVS